MNNKTKKVIEGFLYVDPEWDAVVMKTGNGYDVMCARQRMGKMEYGHVLASFAYKKSAERAAQSAKTLRNEMLAKAYP